MPVELVVFLICIGGTNCSDAVKQYYNTSPNIKQNVKRYRDKLKEELGNEIVIGVGSAVALASGNSARIKLRKNYQVILGSEKTAIEFNTEF